MFNAGNWMLNRNLNVTHETIAGETRLIYLPDSSSVVLNGNSSVTFDENWKEREVTLKGSGFLQVTPGEKFTVISSNERVDVLGTSFEFIGTEYISKVGCYTGKVKVTIRDECIS